MVQRTKRAKTNAGGQSRYFSRGDDLTMIGSTLETLITPAMAWSAPA
jgi:hypothetical protein